MQRPGSCQSKQGRAGRCSARSEGAEEILGAGALPAAGALRRSLPSLRVAALLVLVCRALSLSLSLSFRAEADDAPPPPTTATLVGADGADGTTTTTGGITGGGGGSIGSVGVTSTATSRDPARGSPSPYARAGGPSGGPPGLMHLRIALVGTVVGRGRAQQQIGVRDSHCNVATLRSASLSPLPLSSCSSFIVPCVRL